MRRAGGGGGGGGRGRGFAVRRVAADEGDEVVAEFGNGLGGGEHGEDEVGDEMAEEVEGEDEGEDDDDGELGDDEDEDDIPKEPAGPDTSVRRYAGHTGPVYCGALSPDGARFLSGSGDDTAHLWPVRGSSAGTVAVSVDGGPAAAAAAAAAEEGDGAAADAATAAAAKAAVAAAGAVVLRGHGESVVCCGFSSDGVFAATGALDGSLRVWDGVTGALLHSPEGPGGEISFLAWHPKGNALLSGASDGTAWLWAVDRAESRFLQVFTCESAVLCGSFSASGKSVLVGCEDGSVTAFNPVSGAQNAHFRGQSHGWLEGPCNAIALHAGAGDAAPAPASASVFAAAGMDGTVRLASLATGKVLATFVHDRAPSDDESCASVECALFSRAQPWLISGATDGSVKVWDLDASAPRGGAMDCGGCVIQLRWLDDHVGSSGGGNLLAATTAHGACAVWDVRRAPDAGPVRSFTGHAGMVYDVVSASGGDELFTCGDDGVVRVYSMRG